MEKQFINTGNTWETDYPYTKGGRAPWTPIAKVKIKDANLIFIAGQVAYDDRGTVIYPDSMKAQAPLVYQNVKQALEAAGAKVSDIVYERANVVEEFMTDFMNYGSKARAKMYAEAGVTKLPPYTLIGVARLAHKDLVLEVEIIAVAE